jgi:hypothetical protein
MEEKMRVISQSELLSLTRAELLALLRKIVCELPYLPEESVELRNAHANLLNIRRALARPDSGGRPELSAWKGVCSPNNPGTALPGVV